MDFSFLGVDEDHDRIVNKYKQVNISRRLLDFKIKIQLLLDSHHHLLLFHVKSLCQALAQSHHFEVQRLLGIVEAVVVKN